MKRLIVALVAIVSGALFFVASAHLALLAVLVVFRKPQNEMLYIIVVLCSTIVVSIVLSMTRGLPAPRIVVPIAAFLAVVAGLYNVVSEAVETYQPIGEYLAFGFACFVSAVFGQVIALQMITLRKPE